MQDCMGKLSRADAGSSGKLRMWAVGRQRLALRAVDVDFPGVICATAKIAGKSKKLVTAIFRRRSRIAFLCELKSIPAGSRTMLVKTGVAGCAECHKRM